VASYDSGAQQAFRLTVQYPWPRAGDVSIFSQFASWDCGAYLAIAAHGYKAGSPLCAYYPLWPALLAPLLYVFGAKLGFLLAHLLNGATFLWALREFYRFSADATDSVTAKWSLVLLLALPGAIFHFLLYTESLFLLLSVMFFRYMKCGPLWVLCIVSFLLPLCKAIGIFASIPAILYILTNQMRKRAICGLVALLIGYAAYFAVMMLFTSNPFEGFDAQRFFVNSPSIAHIFQPARVLTAFCSVRDLFDLTGGALDRVLFVVFLLFLRQAWRMDRVLGTYVAAIGSIPAMSNLFLSYTRFFSVCFPIIIAIASLFVKSGHTKALGWIVVSSWLVQLMAMTRFLSFEWVG
jgi:hypothetical protein